MFWDFIALNWKSSCYIYQFENKKNQETSISAFAVENLLQRSIKQTTYAEKNMNCLQKDLKTFSFRFSLCCCFKREEIDWYKYNRCILQFLLLSVYHQFQVTYCFMSITALLIDWLSGWILSWYVEFDSIQSRIAHIFNSIQVELSIFSIWHDSTQLEIESIWFNSSRTQAWCQES